MTGAAEAVYFHTCPYASVGISYKPFPITGYPSELEDALRSIPRGETSSNAHPLITGAAQYDRGKFQRKILPKKVLLKLPDRVLKKMGLERPTVPVEYCQTCKMSVLRKKYKKHCKSQTHIKKAAENLRFTTDMLDSYQPSFPSGTPVEDEMDFPKFDRINIPSPPAVLPSLSCPLKPLSRPPKRVRKKEYCKTCKVVILQTKFAKHCDKPSHVEKAKRNSLSGIGVSSSHQTSNSFVTAAEDVEFPTFDQINFAQPPAVLPPLSYPLVKQS